MGSKNIVLPDVGGAAEVTVVEILVQPGDIIQKDAPIVTLESDKATMEIPTTDAGKVKSITVKVGDVINTGSVLLTLETDAKEETSSPEANKVEKIKQSQQVVEKESHLVKDEKEYPTKESKSALHTSSKSPVFTSNEAEEEGDVYAGPGVRRLARELGVSLNTVKGSGQKNRIVKEDVHAFVKTELQRLQSSSPHTMAAAPIIDFAQFGEIETHALSRIKKISGRNLHRNWTQIPHVTQFGEADITELERFRLDKKADMEKQGVKLTPLVFIMRAVVSALKAFPHVNASLDATTDNLILKKYFHVGVAVDTSDGLVVPVIRDVDQKNLLELARELGVMSQKARQKQLLPSDMQGGCFSISSLGGIGGTAFTPIINAPEVAILGVSTAAYKAIYRDGEWVPRLMLPLSLSYDHRVVDGADGARFMMYLINMLSDIRNLLL